MTDAALPDAPPAASAKPAAPPGPRRSLLGNLLRGLLIGVVETVPGVSGGTVALVTGVYGELIDSGHHLTAAARCLLTGKRTRTRALAHLRAVSWRCVIPLAIGMVAAVLTVAGPVGRLVESHPQTMRALFLGLVAGSVLVPLRLAGGGWRAPEWARFALGVLAGLLFTSLPTASLDPSPWIIAPAAAIAVCALVLPGLSGSFILLGLGLYQPTLQAVAERDLGYLAWFGLWACVGLVLVVRLMRHLLVHHHRATMVVLSGVMVGALRSLWPWQDAAGGLLAPTTGWPLLLALALAGVVLVQALVLLESRSRTLPAPAAPVDPGIDRG